MQIRGVTMGRLRKRMIVGGFLLLALVFLFSGVGAEAGMKSPPPEKMDVVIVGDRVVDIAYNLGVLPAAMSVRASLWPMAKELKTVSQILGCPRCVTVKDRQAVPKALKKFGIHRIIVEKSDPFCLYKPEVKPEDVVAILEEAGMDVTVDYVDFSKGLKSAIGQVAALVHREDKAEALIAEYDAALAAALAKCSGEKSGKRVIILNGIYQPSTGRSILRVEAPGGYADVFLLEKLGLVNAGDAFRPEEGKPEKGYYMVRKGKNGMVLEPLIKANPDILVITGDASAVQKAISDYLEMHPEMAELEVFRRMAVYVLPTYVDSGVLEYPEILKEWAVTLVP